MSNIIYYNRIFTSDLNISIKLNKYFKSSVNLDLLNKYINILVEYINNYFNKFNSDSKINKCESIIEKEYLFRCSPIYVMALMSGLSYKEIIKFCKYKENTFDVTSMIKSYMIKSIFNYLNKQYYNSSIIVNFGGDIIGKNIEKDDIMLLNEYGRKISILNNKNNIFSIATSSNISDSRGKHIFIENNKKKNKNYITVVSSDDNIFLNNYISVKLISGGKLPELYYRNKDRLKIFNEKGELS